MVWFRKWEIEIWKMKKYVQMFDALARSTPGGVGGLLIGQWFCMAIKPLASSLAAFSPSTVMIITYRSIPTNSTT